MAKRLSRSFACAISGIAYAFLRQRNMKIHCLAAILVVIDGLTVGLSQIEWAVISITIFLVLTAETINTAIEKTVDLITDDYHMMAKLAKDLAAGAVLLTAINSLVISLLIFGHHLW
jgi:diacylglycerol kinase